MSEDSAAPLAQLKAATLPSSGLPANAGRDLSVRARRVGPNAGWPTPVLRQTVFRSFAAVGSVPLPATLPGGHACTRGPALYFLRCRKIPALSFPPPQLAVPDPAIPPVSTR